MALTTEELYGIQLDQIDPTAPSESLYMADYLPMHITYHTNFGYTWGWYFSSWRDEALAWHEACTLGANLNPTPGCVIKGPEAKKFLQKYLVNNFDKFPVGTSKHGMLVDEEGKLVMNGVIMRTDEQAYEMHWLSPIINGLFDSEKGNFDAELEDITMSRFLFQLSGPKSLQIIEAATREDLHDLKFNRIRHCQIDGMPVRILRFGMTGGLGYEVHGNFEDAKKVHLALMKAGNPFGLRLLGIQAYMMNHTLGGSIQFGLHFLAQMTEGLDMGLHGSARMEPQKMRFNPYELGLGRVINYDHDFVGKEALLEARENQTRTVVSLEWNAEDVGEIYASQFRPGEEPYAPIKTPGPNELYDCAVLQEFDYVYDADGNEVGISSGRTMSPWHNAMVSLSVLPIEQAVMGNEVTILFGDPGTRQKKVRAKVCPIPYNTHLSNKTFDVEEIPHPVFE